METIHLACGFERDTVKLDINNNYGIFTLLNAWVYTAWLNWCLAMLQSECSCIIINIIILILMCDFPLQTRDAYMFMLKKTWDWIALAYQEWEATTQH